MVSAVVFASICFPASYRAAGTSLFSSHAVLFQFPLVSFPNSPFPLPMCFQALPRLPAQLVEESPIPCLVLLLWRFFVFCFMLGVRKRGDGFVLVLVVISFLKAVRLVGAIGPQKPSRVCESLEDKF